MVFPNIDTCGCNRSSKRPQTASRTADFLDSSANTSNDETKKEIWEKYRAVSTAFYEGGWSLVQVIEKNDKSHDTVWQVLNNRWCVSETVSGSVSRSLTCHAILFIISKNTKLLRLTNCQI